MGLYAFLGSGLHGTFTGKSQDATARGCRRMANGGLVAASPHGLSYSNWVACGTSLIALGSSAEDLAPFTPTWYFKAIAKFNRLVYNALEFV